MFIVQNAFVHIFNLCKWLGEEGDKQYFMLETIVD